MMTRTPCCGTVPDVFVTLGVYRCRCGNKYDLDTHKPLADAERAEKEAE